MKTTNPHRKYCYVILFLCLLFPYMVWGQDYTITEIKELPHDLTARTNPRQDLNGELCAVLKINMPGVVQSVEGSTTVGENIKTTSHTLAYVPKGTKSVRIVLKNSKSEEVIFKDWGINVVQAGSCIEIVMEDLANLDEMVMISKAKVYLDHHLHKPLKQLFNKILTTAKNEEVRQAGAILFAQYYLETEKDTAKAHSVLSCLPEGDRKYLCIGSIKCAEKKFKEGIENLKKAEQYGSKDASLLLLRIYKGEIETEYKDAKLAYKYGMTVASQGNMDAQHYVACCYLGGMGVQANLDDAIEYLTMAATQGKVESQRMLGAIYVTEQKRDLAKARRWLRMAASQKDKEATKLLDEIGWD